MRCGQLVRNERKKRVDAYRTRGRESEQEADHPEQPAKACACAGPSGARASAPASSARAEPARRRARRTAPRPGSPPPHAGARTAPTSASPRSPPGARSTESSPMKTDARALPGRGGPPLLLLVGTANRSRWNRAADHSGDRDQGEDVRKRLEEHGRRIGVHGQPLRERVREAEQERRHRRPERAASCRRSPPRAR